MDRSALVLLVSKPLQEETISPTIDTDSYVSDMSGKKKSLNLLDCTFKICILASVCGNHRNHSDCPPLYFLSTEIVQLLPSLSPDRLFIYYCV